MEEFTKSYKALVKESLITNNKTLLIKKCEAFTNEVIKKDVLPEDIVEIHKDYINTLDLTEEDILETLDVLQEVVKGFDIVTEITKDLLISFKSTIKKWI